MAAGQRMTRRSYVAQTTITLAATLALITTLTVAAQSQPAPGAERVKRIEEAIAAASDANEKQALVRQLADEPSLAALKAAVACMKKDAALRETAAKAAADLGERMARTHRVEVKAAMQAVLATSKVPVTITKADIALRNAARSENLASRSQAGAYTPLPAGPPGYSWSKSDSGIALLNHDRVVWRFVYGKEAPKPFLHPLALNDGVQLTWKSPPDHPWHRGLWFAWKELNNVNYWEEDADTHQAEGLTEVTSADVETAADFSAKVKLIISYHPPGKPEVLAEKRIVRISLPDEKGNYFVDWEGTFTAGSQDVLLKGGTAGGGYAGLSIRIAPETHDWRLMDSEGREDTPGSGPLAKNMHGQRARWADFIVIDNASGQSAGLAFMEHPKTLRHPTQWHCVLEDKIPFGCFSPSPLWSEPYTVKAGESFVLSYRILVHRDRLSRETIEAGWRQFTGGSK
jgi:hypothetical protein